MRQTRENSGYEGKREKFFDKMSTNRSVVYLISNYTGIPARTYRTFGADL